MKNIHILPIDKPSRLRYNLSNVLVFTNELYRDYGKKDNHHIYITSDEEVKKGDYFLYDGTKIRYKSNGTEYHGRDLCHISGNHRYPVSESKKIILTTDQDLIKYGVQAIDDEFLKWFVKNPSCEFVEVNLVPVNEYGSEITIGGYGVNKFIYKIIIPQEKPKQEIKLEDIKNQIILTKARGEKFAKYLDMYKGQSIYNEIALAIEFGYQLKLEENEK